MMICLELESDFINGEQPTLARPKQQGHPAWLQSFVNSEDYFSDCSLNCFSGNMYEEFGERLLRSHGRRYFCTQCPEDGVTCIGRIIAQHMRHRVLKVRKLMQVEGPLIKVADIEPFLNISYIVRHPSANGEPELIKLRTTRQPVWGAGCKQGVPCYECLQLASIDHIHKYCSIKCAYPSSSKVEIVLEPPRISIGCRSRRNHRAFLKSELTLPASLAFESLPRKISASPSEPESVPSPFKVWVSRMSKFLNFGSWKKRKLVPPKKTTTKKHNSPVTTSSRDPKSSRVRSKALAVKESDEQQRETGDVAHDQTHPSGRPPRRTREEKRMPQDIETEKHRSSQTPRDSCSTESASTTTAAPLPAPRSVNGVKGKADPVTSIYRRAEHDCGPPNKVEVRKKGRAVRSRVLNSACMAFARVYRFRSKSKRTTEPTGQSGRASQGLVLYSRRSRNRIISGRRTCPQVDGLEIRIAGNPPAHHEERVA